MKTLRTAALALAASGTLAAALPATAATATHAAGVSASDTLGIDGWDHGRKHRHRHYDRGYDDYGRGEYRDSYYAQPVRRDTRTWRGDDGRYYCRKDNGTTGLLIGGAVGGLAGHEIAGRGGDRTLGVILGAAGGALLGREIDRGGSRCR